MAKRSLKASETGQIEAKLAFERTGWTQAQLATQVGLGTRQSVWKFFTGRPVDRSIFVDLCYQLDLEWESIVDTPVIKAKTQPAQSSVSAVKTRLLEKLQSSLSKTTMPFDICQPLPLNQIYTPQFFLPTISSQRWLERHELPAMHPGRMTAKTTANHAATQFAQHHQKLVILGNPGSGKTTLLHHLASQCWSSEIYADSIPVFISLRSFVVQHPDCQFPALDAYLETQFLAIAPSMPISELLQQGKFLFLIDGLDEVGLEAMSPLCQTIQRWTQVYGLNRFIVTCRTAARQYLFQGFTYTELAEFNPEQIEQFVEKFFLSTSTTHEDGEQKAQEFLEQLYRKPNQPIRDLVTTPILLNLVCSIFLARKTLPVNRAKLYQAGLDILMEQWDEARGINRDSTGSLLLSKVERLKLLSYLAAQTFEQGKFFFDKQDILPIIVEHRQRLQEQPSDDAEHLWAQGEQIIRAIAAQNGLLVEKAKDIYCFSHLTFHEYLTARNIVAAPNPEALEQRLRELAAKVEHHHWQEIIFLTVNLLTEPLQFLAMLQANILAIAMPSAKVRRFLDMIDQKVQQLSLAYPQWSLRTFYFSSLINADRKLSFTAEPLIARQLASELALDLKLIGLLSAIEQVIEAPSMSNMLALYSALNFEAQHALDPEFLTSVQALRAELPRHLSESHTQQDWWKQRTQQNWWEQEGQDWLRRWKLAVKEHRGLSLDWQWSEDEAQILQTYYQANQLLVNCLQFEARLTVPEREAIMDQLLVVPSNEAASEITAQ